MKNTIIKIFVGIGLGFLPFLIFITYNHFTNGIYVLNYYEKILLLLLGPITFLLEDPVSLVYSPYTEKINYFGLMSLIVMFSSLILGLAKFNKHWFYKVLFALGTLIWFGFGLVIIGISYLAGV